MLDGSHSSAVFLTSSILATFLGLTTAIGCIGNKHEKVDWFATYKLPKDHESSNRFIKDGVGHMYLDVINSKWQLSGVSVNSSSQAVAYTLDQIYEGGKSNDIAYLMYNDEPSDGSEHDNRGHLKGVVAFDSKEGFWLVHSTPKFPPVLKDGYSYPWSGTLYGQTFLCMTLSGSNFNAIAKQLLVSWPKVYDYRIPNSSPYAKDETIQQVVAGKHDTEIQHMVNLSTIKGQKFVSFSKSKKFGKDLYSAWVAPSLKASLYTETWRNGAGDMPSYCSSNYKVENIEELSLPFGVNFKGTKDHSKWAVTNSARIRWVCIGDINRQVSQDHRGGGTVCTKHAGLFNAFSSAVKAVEKCSKRRAETDMETNPDLLFEPGS